MKPKLTPWFPPEVKPVHVGVYETGDADWYKETGLSFLREWNGKAWIVPVSGKRGFECRQQKRVWRGLARKPK